MNKEEKNSIKLDVPMNIVRWLIYSVCFAALLLPFTLTVWEYLSCSLMIGWLFSLLNGINENLKNKSANK